MGKRLLILTLLGLAVWLVSVPRAEATGCRAFVHRNVIVEKVAVVEKVAPVIASFVPVPVLQYSATYAPGVPYSGPPAPVAGQSQDAVLAALQRLEQRLAGLERRAGIQPQEAPPMPGADQKPAPSPTPAPQGGGFGAMLNKSCVACHEAAVAKRDGGGLVLATGTAVAQLTPEQRLRVIERVRAGEMPPANNNRNIKPPTDEEFDAALAELVRRK